MAKVTIGKCGKCGKELMVKEAAAKSVMHLTCKCGWTGYVGHNTCKICGKKLVAINGQYPLSLCPGQCEEELEQRLKKQRLDLEHKLNPKVFINGRYLSNIRNRFIAELCPQWPVIFDSSEFWWQKQVPILHPHIEFPFIASLDVSADGESLAWLSPKASNELEVAIFSPSFTSELIKIPYSAQLRWPSEKWPSCLFIGNDRVLVIAEDKMGICLSLYDSINARKLSEVNISDCYFSWPSVHHSTKRIAAVNASGHSDFDLLMCETAGDHITYVKLKTWQIFPPGPKFGPDGRIYIFTTVRDIYGVNLYRIEEGEIAPIIRGVGQHCVYFDPSGKLYCGDGFDDRSALSSLNISDLENNQTQYIPWGVLPITQIEPADDRNLLISNDTPNNFQFICLFSTVENKAIWALHLYGFPRWRKPVLLTCCDEKWALVQTMNSIRRISLPEGKSIQMIIKQKPDRFFDELIEAKWLPSKRLLCVARNPIERSPGVLECYKIE